MKHAWLIIAHNEFEILQLLINALDSPQSDIFVHIDKKVKVLPSLDASYSSLHILDKRQDVRWGSPSQIRCELALMEEALRFGPYDFCHIISGTHLPVKNREAMQTFFEEREGTELMNLWEEDSRDIGNKLSRYNFFVGAFSHRIPLIRRAARFAWTAAHFIQKRCRVNRFGEEPFYKSDNWLSLTYPAVRYLVERKKEILRKYRFTYCADEYFVATELMKVPGRFRIADCKNLLKVVFIRHNPEVLTMEWYDTIMDSGCLFARKFSSAHMDVAMRVLKENGYA